MKSFNEIYEKVYKENVYILENIRKSAMDRILFVSIASLIAGSILTYILSNGFFLVFSIFIVFLYSQF